MKWAPSEILEEMLENALKFLKEGEVDKAHKQLECAMKGQYIRKKKLREKIKPYDKEEPPSNPLDDLSELLTELKVLGTREPDWDKWENNP